MHYYMLKTLEFGPVVLEKIVQEIDPTRFDERTDPDRFTIREAVAHLADWEPIWLERITKIKAQPGVEILSIDEGELAIKNKYHEQDVFENLARLKEGRAKVAAFFRSLEKEDWPKKGVRNDVGDMTLEDFAGLLVGHDMYHLEHAAQFL